MKRHLFKIILGGFIVFLALPVIFDGEDSELPASKSSSAVSADSAQGQEAMLPVVQKALPFRSENVLSKYAGRFKRFYVNSKEEKQKISQEIQQEQNGMVYASADSFGDGVRSSYGRAASAEDEAYVKEYFTDVEAKDAPADYGAIPAATGTKQKIHDNAPVKGLYESSAVDSYEARIKAKEVYSNVMNRVDTATAPKDAVEADDVFVSAPSSKRAVYASASDSQDGRKASAKAESKYIGIASKGSSRPSSVSSGSLSGGFGSGGVSAKEADSSSGGISMSNFEVAAQNVEGKVEKVAPEGGVSKSFTVVSNGQAGAQKPSNPAAPNQPQKPNVQPNNPANPNNPNTPNNPGNTENPGGHPHPTPAIFNLNDWPQIDPNVTTCALPITTPAFTPVITPAKKEEATTSQPLNKADAEKKKEEKPQEEQTPPANEIKDEASSEADIVNPSCPHDLPQFPEDVKKFKLLVEAGVTKDGKRAVYTESYLAGMPSIVGGMGGEIYNTGKEIDPKNMPGIVLVNNAKYWEMASSKDVINLATSEDVKARQPRNTVSVKGEQFKKISGLNSLKDAVSELILSNQKKEEEANKRTSNNKTEVVTKTKEAVEKVNGK